jgi:hypothetical protein
MNKDAILSLCNHIRNRQEDYGPAEGFKFCAYFDGKKMVKAEYGRKADDEKAAARGKAKQAARKEKRQKQKEMQKGKEMSTHPNVDDNALEANDTPFVLQIDPRLLGVSGGESTNDSTTMFQAPFSHSETGKIIDEFEMQKLKAIGYPSTIPVNGPNDGPPRYYVDAAALQLLSTIPSGSRSQNQPLGITHGSDSPQLDDPQSKSSHKIQKPRRSNRKVRVQADEEPQKMKTRSQKKGRAKASRR